MGAAAARLAWIMRRTWLPQAERCEHCAAVVGTTMLVWGGVRKADPRHDSDVTDVAGRALPHRPLPPSFVTS